ncbi:MAG TPA: hypothetical protein VGN72_07750 [Tepidisphaeraceae bacterium]|jgi:hypothetical protein|nr:hypothetical protein [Tepidisphaeraceae bacterium]
MPDPFANIPTLDAADLTDICEIDGLGEPFDDAPDFDPELNPEVDATARLDDAHLHMQTPRRRLFIDYRPDPDALLHLKTLPTEGQTLHGVICQKYAAWDLVPALIGRTGRNIDELYIATLSYGAGNAKELLALLDEGRIKRCSLIVSHYFKAQNRQLYDSLVPPLLERGHRVIAMRNHSKLLLMQTAGAGSFVVEGSANLRSCKNVEQFCLTRCRQLYRFHRGWIERELFARREEGKTND